MPTGSSDTVIRRARKGAVATIVAPPLETEDTSVRKDLMLSAMKGAPVDSMLEHE